MLRQAMQLAAAAALSLGIAGAAQALEPGWKSLEVNSTAISGYGGNLEVLELGTATNHAVYGIGSREVWNRPCELFVWTRNLDFELGRRRRRRICRPLQLDRKRQDRQLRL